MNHSTLILGSGKEGIVSREGSFVIKRFFDEKPSEAKVEWLRSNLIQTFPYLPEPVWEKEGTTWCARYPWFESEHVEILELEELRPFFQFCLKRGIVTPNIKRTNFRRSKLGLSFIDIGSDIHEMNVDYFRDSCARGYALAALDWTDEELHRRSWELRNEGMLRSLPGFEAWYASLLQDCARSQWAECGESPEFRQSVVADDVTLMIKACAMDAEFLSEQVRHIVGQLQHPKRFAERVLLLDPFRGPFVRPHSIGDWDRLIEQSQWLVDNGWLDKVMVAPTEIDNIIDLYSRWFGIVCSNSHCIRGVPVFPQLWGFEQVRTRYILQCDLDVLIGRISMEHDYLVEMIDAVAPENVLGAAFNIPQLVDGGFRPYDAPPGEFVPEVRCGLLDLCKVFACRPLPNALVDGKLKLTWYRSLQAYQKICGLRTVRGGDPRTFYVHPSNELKMNRDLLDRARDLLAQGIFPLVQSRNWAVVEDQNAWKYPQRDEEVVFLVRGRDTDLAKIRRCVQSLAVQDDSQFGVVFIDDASVNIYNRDLPALLSPLRGRYTLVRRARHHGYMPNLLLASKEIVSSANSLIVILDMDDALFSRSAVRRIRDALYSGHDVIWAAMFRPDKPLKLYHPAREHARIRWGGEVWIHLRAFQRHLLDRVHESDLKLDDDWITDCEDYATMLPIAELSQNPVYIPEYLYFHERSVKTDIETRSRKDKLIRRILSKPDRSIVRSLLSRNTFPKLIY